jgi:hypothetical protein
VLGETLSSKAWFGGEFFLTRNVALGMDAGYRDARIDEIWNARGIRVVNADGSNFSLDFSGVFAQGGLRVYF